MRTRRLIVTGTLVSPLYGTLEDSNATNAVRYRNTNLSATSDTFTVRDDVGQPIVYNVTITVEGAIDPGGRTANDLTHTPRGIIV